MTLQETRPTVAAANRAPARRPFQKPSPVRGGGRAVALIIVLCFIALATVLVVAFMANVTVTGVTERAATSESSASQLAGSAVQLVEGAITYATEPRATTNAAWACQPGMIRTYGSGTPDSPGVSSDPLAYYKLYSSDTMVISGKDACNAFTAKSGNDVPKQWENLPSLYTDLNAPLVSNASGKTTTIFPVVDPRASDLGVEGFDYRAASAAVDGTVLTKGNPDIPFNAANFSADSGARLPMPVRWMYVLRDGTMTVPDGPNTATWGGAVANAPTAANPIVGRVAFWTDDECGKININTASEGTYADMPIANVGPLNAGSQPISFVYPQTTPVGDVLLAVNQGAQREYQRYPGHPATTSLSTVFGAALSSLGTPGTAAMRQTVVKTITDTIPRVSDYATPAPGSGMSSMGGTQNPAPSPYPKPPATPPPLQPDLDRLYASLDEFQFNTQRVAPNLDTGATQGTQDNLVDACRFFVTANSKAPEVNLFGLPRVAIWPVWDPNNPAVADKSTAFDQEMLRCATVAADSNPHQMIFARADPTNVAYATTDFKIPRNQQVYGYLKTLTSRAVPGFGGSFSAKYGSADQSQILTEIFDYIRCTNLADQSDGTTDHSYTPSILPAYITDGNDPRLKVPVGQVVPTQNGGSQGFGRIATIAELALVLTKVDDRNDINQQEGLIYFTDPVTKKQIPVTNLVKSLSYSGDSAPGTIDPTKKTLLEWALVPKCFSPMAGYAGLGNDFRFKFAVTNLRIGDAPAINKPLGTLADLFDKGRLPNGGRDSVLGGLMGFEFLVNISKGAQPASLFPTGLCEVTGTNASVTYALSNSTTGGTIPISGTVQVTVYSPNGSSSPIQTLNFEFPTVDPTGKPVPNVPIPEITYANGFGQPSGTFRQATYTGNYKQSAYSPTKTAAFSYSTINSLHGGGTNNRVWDKFMDHMMRDGIGKLSAPMPTKGINGSEVVRSLVPTGTVPMQSSNGSPVQIPINGDLRYIAANPNVPKEAWQLTQKNVGSSSLGVSGGTPATPTDYLVSSLRLSNYFYVGGGAEGSLIPLTVPPGDKNPMSYGRPPEVPPGIPFVVMAPADSKGGPVVPGDWDNGPGLSPDGPYINKPNEGEIPTADQYGDIPIPYVGAENTSSYGAAASVFFSPNEQVPSPVMFGSLSVGLDHPWRTLLFRPPSLPGYEGGYTHPGGKDATIRDHLLLDLFWMPVVEPYGISEPLATSGKINLNTQIAPFSYITRTTGLRAVLKAVMLTALNPAQTADKSGKNKLIKTYKNGYQPPNAPFNPGYSQNDLAFDRYPIDLDATVGQLTTATADQAIFPEFVRGTHTADAPNFFVSPTQICDVPLVPAGSVGSLSSFWATNIMTGDNSLERPYALIYPRVTTKSNIFTVYVVAQSLKKIVNDPSQNVWNENKDQVLGEYRASYTIERYLNPDNDDMTSDTDGKTICPADKDASISPTAGLRSTKWRLLSLKRFGQ